MEVLGKYRATEDYIKKSNNELSLKIGDVVEVFMRGQHIWYGRVNETKGFFPGKVVVQIDKQIEVCDNNEEAAFQANETTKPLLNVTCSETGAIDVKVLDDFEVIGKTDLLNLSHKSRVRGAGRPPSYIFLKDTILAKSEIEDNPFWSSESEEDAIDSRTTQITSIQQLVKDVMHRQNLKHVVQNESAINTNSNDKPDWTKILNKSKIINVSPLKEKDPVNKIAPWMEEVRRRRQSKEATPNNSPQKTETSNKIELQSVTETSSANIMSVMEGVLDFSEVQTTRSASFSTRSKQTNTKVLSKLEMKTKRSSIADIKIQSKETEPSEVIIMQSESVADALVAPNLDATIQAQPKLDVTTATVVDNIQSTTNVQEKHIGSRSKSSHSRSSESKEEATVSQTKSETAINTVKIEDPKNHSARSNLLVSSATATTSISIAQMETKNLKKEEQQLVQQTTSSKANTYQQQATTINVSSDTNNTAALTQTKSESSITHFSTVSTIKTESRDVEKVAKFIETLEKTEESKKPKEEASVNPKSIDQQATTEKLRVLLTTLEEFEDKSKERSLKIQNELSSIRVQVDRQNEDIANYVAKMKVQLNEILKINEM